MYEVDTQSQCSDNLEEWGREGGDGGIQEEGRGFHLNEYTPGRGDSTTLGKTYCVAQAMDTHLYLILITT